VRALLCCVIVALVASATRVSAHAVLTKASVRDTPVRADTATSVTLSFNTGIEPGFTQVVLRSEGPDRALTASPGANASEVIVAVPPLPAGAYALRYKVLAADGHVTEGVQRFQVTPAE
jgi:methionine-rich copper-binding protein CopC